MKKMALYTLLALMAAIFADGCSSTQSLQEYYVDNAENPNFLSFDVPASILKLDNASLSEPQAAALRSLKKLNILAFRKTDANQAEFQLEKKNVGTILKNDKYTELMKMNTAFGKGTVKYLGDEDAIDEVIIFGSNDEKGFALVRVLGDDMNPALMAQLLQAIQQADFKGEGLEKIADFFKD